MQSRKGMRLAACIAPPLGAFTVAVLVSCRDTATPRRAEQLSNDASVTAPVGIPPAAVRARTRLHQRNPLEWVGLAHNRAIDDFRKELRKPGVLSGDMRQSIAGFVT